MNQWRPVALILALSVLSCREASVAPDLAEAPAPSFAVTASGSGYTAIDLGTLGGSWSRAYAINDAGQIVGHSGPPDDFGQTAFLWQDGAMLDLGWLGGSMSMAHDINNAGQVVGWSEPNWVRTGFLWENGVMRAIGTPGVWWEARGINDLGQVIGLAGGHPVLWEGGTMRDLGFTATPTSINNVGQVVGCCYVASSRAFLWEDGLGMQDLGSLGGGWSSAWDINDAGQVVGVSQTSEGHTMAFLRNADGTWRNLGTVGPSNGASWAYGINDLGQIVGWSLTNTPGYQQHATLWDGDTIHDLGTLGGTMSLAMDINNAGEIVGYSTTTDGRHHATLWARLTPTQTTQLVAQTIASLVSAGSLNSGQAGSLVNRVTIAAAMVERGNTSAAKRVLEAFIAQTRGMVAAGLLTSAEGDRLVQPTLALIVNLGG